MNAEASRALASDDVRVKPGDHTGGRLKPGHLDPTKTCSLKSKILRFASFY